MNLVQAWKAISPSTIVGILDTVRNRILNFVLEIETAAPDAGEGTISPGLTPKKVTNVFNTYIKGSVGNVATGSTQLSQQASVTVNQGDWKSLATYLRSLGVEDIDITCLEDAVKEEPKALPTGFGKKVASWIGKMTAKSAQGIWNVTTTIASNVLSKALAQYYGLPNP
jgi:adenylosuccinate lyase